MKNLFLTMTLLFTFSVNSSEVDLKKSEFKWKGTKVTGKHLGVVGLKSAKLMDKKGVIESGVLEIDLNTIAVSDLQGEWKQKLEGHLKSKDFFDLAKFPTAKLEVNSAKDGKFKGFLTIKGKKHPFETPFTKSGKTYSGKLKFDRTKYDMVYNSGNFFKDLGDKMIHNDVEIDFKLVVK
jgi:hypothetical protein